VEYVNFVIVILLIGQSLSPVFSLRLLAFITCSFICTDKDT